MKPQPGITKRMKHNLFRAYLLLALQWSGAAVSAAPDLQPVSDTQLKKLAADLFAQSVEIEDHNGQRRGRTPEGYYVVLTGDYAAPRGYRGPTSVLLLLSSDMTVIHDAALVESADSPAYVRRAVRRGLLERLKNKPVPQSGDVDLDAVSGATRTSDAVQQAVNETLRQLHAEEAGAGE
jgi:hypothetical protein